MLELGGLVKIAVEFDARMLLVGVVHFVRLVAPWVVLERDLLRLEREERAWRLLSRLLVHSVRQARLLSYTQV
jgi:hypothetical protein